MSARPDPIDTLSACEKEDLRLFAQGLTAKEIADRRQCDVRTIDKELERAREKCGVSKTVTVAVMLAVREDRLARGVNIRTTPNLSPRPRRVHRRRVKPPCRRRPTSTSGTKSRRKPPRKAPRAGEQKPRG